MTAVEIAVLRRPEDLTNAWLESVLVTGSIERFSAEPIGTGQMSDRTAGPSSCPRGVR